MQNQYSRLELVYGPDPLEKLSKSRVAVFGVGGVGGYVVEALARCGVGTIDIIDDDRICLTNLNRQIIATRDTVGDQKVDACEARIHAIDPRITVNKYPTFYLPETADQFDFTAYDYVVDAIDTVTAKIDLIMQCKKVGTPIISSMGCGNRIDPTKLVITDIYKTSMDPLSKVMRKEMKKRRVKKLKVIYSTEPPITPFRDPLAACRDHCICPPGTQRTCVQRRTVPGSTPFVPAAAGLAIASEVVKDITEFDPNVRTKGGKQ